MTNSKAEEIRSRKRMRGIAFVVAIAAAVPAVADEPLPPPARVTKCSRNGAFCAVSDPARNVVTGYRAEDRSAELWHIDGWQRSFDVSDDGEHLVVCHGGLNLLPLDYKPEQVILSFYDRGALVRQWTLREIVPDLTKLKRTASHYAWGQCVGYQSDHAYEVTTEDRGNLLFDVTSGRFASQARASDAEEKYIRTRDEFLHHFEKRQDEQGEKKALSDLEEQLRALIGPSQVKGFPETGRITLESLDPEEPGSDQLDGLLYAATADEAVVVTTARLLENFLERHPRIPKSQSKLARDGRFLSAVMDWDAGFWNFSEIPVRAKANSAAYASLVYGGQDTLPRPPDWIVVFVAAASRVVIMSQRLTAGEVDQIHACGDKWEAAGQASMSDEQFEAYASCWRKHAKDQIFFRALQRRAQALAESATTR